MDSGPKNPNNKFVESERKNQSESREKILEDSIKRKELHMYKHKKYPRSCPSSTIESTVFFLFTVVFSSTFCSLFSFFLLFFFFSPSSFLSLFALYTTCESGVQSFSVPFRPSLNVLLLAVRLLVHCSSITFTLMRPESWLGSI